MQLKGKGFVLISILENNLSAVMEVDGRGVIVSANTAVHRLFGYDNGKLISRQARMILPDTADPSVPAGVLAKLMAAVNDNTAETVGLRKDDTEFSVEIVMTKASCADKDLYVCQMRDISRRQLSESMDSVLHTTLRRVLRGQTYEQFCSFICDKIAAMLGCPLVWIGTKENDGLIKVCAASGKLAEGFPSKQIRWDDLTETFGPTGHAVRTKQTCIVQLDGDQITDSDGRAHTRQIIVFPLLSHSGVLGVLEIHSRLGKLDQGTIQRLESFSLRIAMAMQIAADQQNLRLQRAAMASAASAIFITDADGKILWINKAFSRLSGYREDEVVNHRVSLLKSGVQNDAFYKEMWDTVKSGKVWRGELVERHKFGSLYTVVQTITPIIDGNTHLSHFVVVHDDVTAKKNAEGRIMHLANYDQLTGLPNRRLFREQLTVITRRAKSRGTKVAVIFADLTNFNRINDTLGHSAGDKLLKVVADRLSKLASSKDFIARIGGDEFAVISEAPSGMDGVALLARNMIETILSPVMLNDNEINVGACVGISIFPDDGEEPDKLVNFADMALHTAVRSAPNSYFFFSQEMNEETEDRLALERDLRKALIQNEFALFFQPQLDLKTGKVRAFEALIRWFHPTRGMVSPMRFIPIAEDTGLIIPLGEWVLKEALRYLKLWDEAGLPEISVAVNLSAVQFQQEDLVSSVEKVLVENNILPRRLELELTESVVMQDARKADNILSRLSKVGVKLAIDDFGTGYSSLSYLKRFEVDRLKIDQSFVRDMTNNYDDAEIAQAIINLGHTLGLEIVSEGVETKEQLELLRRQGCDIIQGYYISKPMPAVEVPDFLKKLESVVF